MVSNIKVSKASRKDKGLDLKATGNSGTLKEGVEGGGTLDKLSKVAKSRRKKKGLRWWRWCVHTELRADRDDRVKSLCGEVHVAVDVSQVGQLDPQRLVHWREVDEGVGRDAVPVQGPPRLVQPDVLLRPPHRVVRPVHGNV